MAVGRVAQLAAKTAVMSAQLTVESMAAWMVVPKAASLAEPWESMMVDRTVVPKAAHLVGSTGDYSAALTVASKVGRTAE